MVEPLELRRAFGRFASGVTVVSCLTDEGAPHGATVSAFTSVSLDPALLQVTLIRTNRIAAMIGGKPFSVSVLAEDQGDAAFHFAGRPRLEEAPWRETALVPVVEGACATFCCRPWAEYDGGDHVIVIGEIADVSMTERAPLVFHSGAFHELGMPLARAPWGWSQDDPHAGWFDSLTSPIPTTETRKAS